ncbi:hypothetical protein Nepgr_006548 [Nepenthes gracilis]|uniref:Uncharacterized protein n=1 Tax=Nepenthes gracilis TaxID=150966 RepID=A0AAD3XHH1_NEPGR|nr:hypothetical protein Nepgr_006548 [Nepenthes gracilis]
MMDGTPKWMLIMLVAEKALGCLDDPFGGNPELVHSRQVLRWIVGFYATFSNLLILPEPNSMLEVLDSNGSTAAAGGMCCLPGICHFMVLHLRATEHRMTPGCELQLLDV